MVKSAVAPTEIMFKMRSVLPYRRPRLSQGLHRREKLRIFVFFLCIMGNRVDRSGTNVLANISQTYILITAINKHDYDLPFFICEKMK